MSKHCSTPNRIISLLNEISHELHEELPQLAGLSRGEKHQFIRMHRETIIDFCDLFGDDATCRLFHLQVKTLERIKGRPADREYKKVTHAEAALLKADTALQVLSKLESRVAHLEVKVTEIAELRREVAELKATFNSFVGDTAERVSTVLIMPLLQALSKHKKLPGGIDILNIKDLLLKQG